MNYLSNQMVSIESWLEAAPQIILQAYIVGSGVHPGKRKLHSLSNHTFSKIFKFFDDFSSGLSSQKYLNLLMILVVERFHKNINISYFLLCSTFFKILKSLKNFSYATSSQKYYHIVFFTLLHFF